MIVFAENMNTELARTRKFPLSTDSFPHERVGSGDKTKAASVKWTCLDILYFNSSNNRL